MSVEPMTKHYGSDMCPICCNEGGRRAPVNTVAIEDSCVWCWGPRLINTRVVPFPAATLQLKRVVTGDFGDFS